MGGCRKRTYAGVPLLLAAGLLVTLLIFFPSEQPASTTGSRNPSAVTDANPKAGASDLRDKALPDLRKMDRTMPAAASRRAAEIFSAWRKDAPQISIADVKRWVAEPVASRHKLRFGGIELSATLDSLLSEDGVTAFGFDIAEPPGRFQGTFLPSGKLRAELFIAGESIAYAVDAEPEDAGWALAETEVSELLCVPPGTVYTKAASADPAEPAAGDPPQSAPPILSSQPGAAHVLYCDFDGETVTHPKWNGGATINAAPHPDANNAVFVTNVWKRVSEDFAPFAINVTTDRAVFDATPTARRVHCIITPTDTATPGSGGVAYLSSFGDGTPCWTFNTDEYGCADTISHEVGHTLGLRHDGRTINGDAYYGGHGSGAVSWAPIMGAAWSDDGGPSVRENVTQWSRGEYANANNTEDDLAIITGSSNGFGYRADGIGDSQATATALKFTGNAVSDAGIIERNTDVDWLSFTTSGGSVTLNVNTLNVNSSGAPQPGANLAVALQLVDSAGSVLQTVNPTNTLSAGISANLAAGTYFLRINGAARGTGSTGFTTYASLGQYTVTGNVPRSGIATLTATPSTRTVSAQGGSFDFSVNSDTSWSWGKDSAWVTSSEETGQSGNQTFSYTVGANTGTAARTATITLTAAGGLTATHQIQQEGTVNDDHGNSTATATAVAPNSTTAGDIETAGDEDFFRIVVASPGTLVVETSGSTDTYGYLLGSAGNQLAENDDSVGRNFRISQAVTAGTYFVRVKHYNASSTGAYQLVATLTPDAQLSLSPPALSVPAAGGNFSFNVTSNALWTWSDNASWVESSEELSQSGGQLFEYTVSPNTSASARSATITLVTGGLTATHVVNQAGASGDDHGNNRASATLIAQNSTTGGNLEAGGDLDYFRIDVTSGGTLTVASTGSIDTYGTLFDSAGNKLAENDDSDVRNFRIAWSVTPGTYYVEVRHYNSTGTGSYQLVSGLDNAPVLSLSATESTFGAAASGGSINVTSNTSWSWASSAGWLTSSETTPQSGNQGFSYNVATNTGAARSATITFTAAGLTPRILTVNQAGASSDDHGDSIANATPIATESNTPGIINVNGDNDYFRIIITQPGQLSVYTTGGTDTFGHLLDSQGNELASNDDTTDRNFRINRAVTAGTYYVRVRGYGSSTGAYSLISMFGGALDDHGNSTATATPINGNSTTAGIIEISGDNDYFRINLTSPGVLTLYSTGSMDPIGHLLDSAGVELASNDDTVGYNFRIDRAVAAGTYYVRVRAFDVGAGSYSLVSEFLPTDDHGNATGTATVIAENSTTGGNLEAAGDSDYFRINVTRAGTLTVSTTGATDTYGRLRSSGGTVLSFNDDTVGTNFRISYPVTVGTYYVQVTHFSSTGTGAYQLVASLPGSPRQLFDAAASSAGLSGAEALPDTAPRGDGVRNLLKYAFNMNLAAADVRTLVQGTGTAGQPSVVLEGTGLTRTLKVEYLRRKNSGLIYQPKWSPSLDPATFVPMSGTPEIIDIDAEWERVIVSQNFDPNVTPMAFATVEVTLP